MTPDKELDYLSRTDEEYGRLKGRVAGLEYRMKIEEAKGYLANEGAVEARKAQARQGTEYVRLLDEFEDASIKLHTVGALRKTAELRIEVWRTMESSRRRGNV